MWEDAGGCGRGHEEGGEAWVEVEEGVLSYRGCWGVKPEHLVSLNPKKTTIITFNIS